MYAAARGSPEILVGAATRTQTGTVRICQTSNSSLISLPSQVASNDLVHYPARWAISKGENGACALSWSGRQTAPSIVSSKATGLSAEQPSQMSSNFCSAARFSRR